MWLGDSLGHLVKSNEGFLLLEDYSSNIDFSGRDISWHQKMSELKTDIWVESLIASIFFLPDLHRKFLVRSNCCEGIHTFRNC